MTKQTIACETCPVGMSGICGLMTDEQRRSLFEMAHQQAFKPGATIVDEDDPERFCAIVISGVAKLSKSFSDGRRQIIGLRFASDIVGRPFGTNPYRVEAATDLLLCKFEMHQFEQLMRDNPCLDHGFSEHTLDELDAAREWMIVLGSMSAPEKIASFLLLVASRGKPRCRANMQSHNGARIDLPLDRHGVAEYLGLRIETVSRQFTRLRAQHIIETEDAGRVVHIRNIEALERLARNTS